MAKTKGRAGLIAAGLGWGLALGVALGALVLAPAMPGSVDLGFSEFKPEAKANVDEEALAAAEGLAALGDGRRGGRARGGSRRSARTGVRLNRVWGA